MSGDDSTGASGDRPPGERRTPPGPDRPWVAPSQRANPDEPLTTTDELPVVPPGSGAGPRMPYPETDATTATYPPPEPRTQQYPPQGVPIPSSGAGQAPPNATQPYPAVAQPGAPYGAPLPPGGPGAWPSAAQPPVGTVPPGGGIPPAQPGPPGSPAVRRANPVGLIAFILAVIALIMAVVPVASFFAGLPAIAAIVLGIIGLVLAGRRRGFAIAGLVLGAVALLVATAVSTVRVVGFVRHQVDELPQISDFPSTLPTDLPSGLPTDGLPTPAGSGLAKGQHTVVYRITGKGTAAITYTTFANGTSANARDTQATLPVTRTQQLRVTSGDAQQFIVAAITLNGKAKLGCSITVDGKVIAQSRSNADSGVELVTCSGRTAPF